MHAFVQLSVTISTRNMKYPDSQRGLPGIWERCRESCCRARAGRCRRRRRWWGWRADAGARCEDRARSRAPQVRRRWSADSRPTESCTARSASWTQCPVHRRQRRSSCPPVCLSTDPAMSSAPRYWRWIVRCRPPRCSFRRRSTSSGLQRPVEPTHRRTLHMYGLRGCNAMVVLSIYPRDNDSKMTYFVSSGT